MSHNPWSAFGQATTIVETRDISEDLIDGAILRRLRFLSHQIDEKPLWVYAVYGRPEGTPRKVPGLVHVHGNNQTACVQHTRYFASRGYALISFDWGGPTKTRSEKFTTSFPSDIPPIEDTECDPDKARVRHLVWIARRALSFLEQQPQVDPERLGIFGTSWGGLACWLVNGTDPRVKATIPIFGCGLRDDLPARAEWRSRYQPSQYAATQSGEICFLNGTNDFFGHLSTLEEFWDDLQVDKRLGLSPNENHGLEEALKLTGRRWFDAKLKKGSPLPVSPELTLDLEDGGMWSEVFAPGAVQVRIFYSVTPDGTNPGSYWYLGPWGTSNDGFFSARWRLPMGSRRVRVFAEATYADGLSLSSMPQDLFEKVGTIALEGFDASIWFDPLMGKTPWYTRWPVRGSGLAPGNGNTKIGRSRHDGRLCLSQVFANKENRFEAILRRPACPVVGVGDGTRLRMQVSCPSGGVMTCTASASQGNRNFEDLMLGEKSLELLAQPQWQDLVISPDHWPDFNFSQIRQLQICFTSKELPGIEIGQISLI